MKFSSIKMLILALVLILSSSALFADFEEQNIKKELPMLLGSANEGREFLLTFHPPWQTSGGDTGIKIYVVSTTNTSVTLEIPAEEYSQTKTATPNNVLVFSIPIDKAIMYAKSSGDKPQPHQIYEKKACIVTADNPIVCYGIAGFAATSDGYLAIPVKALGKRYIVSSWNDPTLDDGSQYLTSYTSIIAAYDDTEVEFTLGGEASNYTPGPAVQRFEILETGDKDKHIMNKGDVWLIGVIGDYSDLSGSYVEADKPVAVISGSFCAYVPLQTPACDYIIGQDLPMENWGTRYHVTPIQDRLKASFIKIYASHHDTRIIRDGDEIGMIKDVGGESGVGYMARRALMESEAIRPVTISADNPISVVQYNPGQNDDGVISDPFQMNLVPISMYSKYITFSLPSDYYPKNYINLCYIPTETEEIPDDIMIGKSKDGEFQWSQLSASIAGNGTEISGTGNPDEENWRVVTIGINDPYGVYAIKGNNPMGAYAYGFGNYEGYGYPLSMSYDLGSTAFDTIAPTIKWNMSCNGDVSGIAIEEPRYIDTIRSNFASGNLINAESYNYEFIWIDEDDFIAGETAEIEWELSRIDQRFNAKATILFIDRNGNETQEVIEYFTTNIKAKPEISIWDKITSLDPASIKEITITNKGSGSIEIDSIFLQSNDKTVEYEYNGFTIIEDLYGSGVLPNLEFATDEEFTFTVQFDPSSVADEIDGDKDTFIDSIMVKATYCEDGDHYVFDESIATVKASTEVLLPIISAGDADFGEVIVGSNSDSQIIEISNIGKGLLTITGAEYDDVIDTIYNIIFLSDLKHSDLSDISDSNPVHLLPNSKQSFRITYTPDEEREYSDTIRFISNSNESSDDYDPLIILNGTGTPPPEIPTLQQPRDNDTNMVVSNLEFYWGEVADIDSYTIEISKDISFSSSIVEDSSPTNSYTLVNTTLEYNTKYYWRVKAIKIDVSSEWSDTWSFTTEQESSIFDNKAVELISVTPNPAVNMITINLEAFKSAKIYNQNGNLVKEATTTTINVSDFARGKYFMIISTDEGIKHGEFIKE